MNDRRTHRNTPTASPSTRDAPNLLSASPTAPHRYMSISKSSVTSVRMHLHGPAPASTCPRSWRPGRFHPSTTGADLPLRAGGTPEGGHRCRRTAPHARFDLRPARAARGRTAEDRDVRVDEATGRLPARSRSTTTRTRQDRSARQAHQLTNAPSASRPAAQTRATGHPPPRAPTARAMTSSDVINAGVACTPIRIFARLANGIVSVGLNALEFVVDRYR